MENIYIRINPFKHKYAKIIATGFAICSILVGIMLVTISRNEEARHKDILEGKLYTYGKITGVEYNADSETYDTQIVFIVDGTSYNFSVSNDTKYKQGSSVKVIYEEGNPYNCALANNSFKSDYLASAIFLVIGIILIPFIHKDIFINIYNEEQNAMRFTNLGDVENYDITNPKRNQQPHKGTNNSSAKVNIGTIAFYNKNKE